MPSLRLKVDSTMPNAAVPDLGFSVRRDFAEIVGFEYEQATGGGATAIPGVSTLTTKALILTANKDVTVALGSISLLAGGFIVVYNGTLGTNPPTVNNASGSTAIIRGVALGDSGG